MGRKKLPADRARSYFMSVRVTPAQKLWLQQEAARIGQRLGHKISLSSVVHCLIVREIRAQTQPSKPHRRDLGQALPGRDGARAGGGVPDPPGDPAHVQTGAAR
jgi:hypothetical protein